MISFILLASVSFASFSDIRVLLINIVTHFEKRIAKNIGCFTLCLMFGAVK